MSESFSPFAKPRLSFTRSGVAFDSEDDLWKFVEERGTQNIDFRWLRQNFSGTILGGIKQTSVELLRTHSVDTVFNAVQRLKHMARTVDLGDAISLPDLINYRARLPKGKHHYLGHISSFMKKWVELSYPGLAPEAVTFFDSIRIEGNEKGSAVRQNCPYSGPFTDIELQAIVEGAREAFRLSRLSPTDYAILLILVATGCRPGQISMLLCEDLLSPALGSTAWRLKVPSLKKRTPERLTRERPLPREVALLLKTQVQQVAHDPRLQAFKPEARPIFVAPGSDFTDRRMAHIGRTGVTEALRRVAEAISVRSERTGEPIQLGPTRFRRTFGTRAIDEGYAPNVVAEMLDHVDLQNVGIYVENRSTIVDRIDAALAKQLGPLARLFLGTVIESENEAAIADPVSRRVRLDYENAIGTCGGPSGCARRAPIACYTCASFLPWKDAPHERLLVALIDERDSLLARGIDPRIAAVNDDGVPGDGVRAPTLGEVRA